MSRCVCVCVWTTGGIKSVCVCVCGGCVRLCHGPPLAECLKREAAAGGADAYDAQPRPAQPDSTKPSAKQWMEDPKGPGAVGGGGKGEGVQSLTLNISISMSHNSGDDVAFRFCEP